MYQNFTEKLMEAKRRARLMGRPLRRSEVAGITAGYAQTASERLARHKQLSLQEKSLEQRGEQFEKSLEQQGEQFEKSLEQRKYETAQELQAAKKAEHREKQGNIAGGAGALIGGALAGSVTGGLGWGMGAMIGGAIGKIVGGGCIIISACTDPDSYEVNIAREYRDNYMSLEELIGYYTLARLVVPIMPKKIVKRYLVDRLVDYGEVILERKKRLRFKSSYWITTGFLKLCEGIGSLYIWRRMEVYDG